jgi:hypothetical protein
LDEEHGDWINWMGASRMRTLLFFLLAILTVNGQIIRKNNFTTNAAPLAWQGQAPVSPIPPE